MMSMWRKLDLGVRGVGPEQRACTMALAIVRPTPKPSSPPSRLVTAASRSRASASDDERADAQSPSATLKAMWPSIGRISVAM